MAKTKKKIHLEWDMEDADALYLLFSEASSRGGMIVDRGWYNDALEVERQLKEAIEAEED